MFPFAVRIFAQLQSYVMDMRENNANYVPDVSQTGNAIGQEEEVSHLLMHITNEMDNLTVEPSYFCLDTEDEVYFSMYD
ncbi:unnamed protein product [Heterobilharzia americana]|nr:unnamed protein product [Heterobilharzia americana]